MTTRSFKVQVPQETLDDLQQRLAKTRWPDEIKDAEWDYGTNLAYLKTLVQYWQSKFDWAEQEEVINRFAHFRTEIDGFGLHFIHERGRGENPLPIILTHGFPDSFLRFAKIIPMLTDPAEYGGDPADSFDVVVPSLPGYGFSDKPEKAGMLFRVADLWAALMTQRLGYERYGAHGGDWGTTVTEHLARSYSDSVVGIHLTDVPFSHLFEKPKDLSASEKKFIARSKKWQQEEGAYAMIQGTKPQSLGYGLNDSPAGLAAWIVEKFRSWSDCDGDIETRFTKDELLTNLTVYWATETINSSFRFYYDAMNAGAMTWIVEMVKKWVGSSKVPTGFASFPRDLLPPPREWAERFFNIQRWTEMPRGGHWAAMEEPELLAEDLRAFFRPLRSPSPR
ncbi:MAG TPA: epoxide hydrolase [Thermoanaerobaculia bacterium]|jgi:microsomal epoxide hydrolase|nr:epoxide hydrolase [Thermoanaerobaculia bacterium]